MRLVIVNFHLPMALIVICCLFCIFIFAIAKAKGKWSLTTILVMPGLFFYAHNSRFFYLRQLNKYIFRPQSSVKNNLII